MVRLMNDSMMAHTGKTHAYEPVTSLEYDSCSAWPSACEIPKFQRADIIKPEKGCCYAVAFFCRTLGNIGRVVSDVDIKLRQASADANAGELLRLEAANLLKRVRRREFEACIAEKLRNNVLS